MCQKVTLQLKSKDFSLPWEQLWTQVIRQLQVPAHFGHNLDALFDVLTDPSSNFLFQVPAYLPPKTEEKARALYQCILDAKEENPFMSVEFEKHPAIEVMEQRYSCRAFEKKPLSPTALEALKIACLTAPTARNRQELHFSFLQNQDRINELSLLINPDRQLNHDSDHVFYEAPLLILIHSPYEDDGQPMTYADIDAGIASQNIGLAATALGLGSCIIGRVRPLNENPEQLELFGVPKTHYLSLAMIVGEIAPKGVKAPHTLNFDLIQEVE